MARPNHYEWSLERRIVEDEAILRCTREGDHEQDLVPLEVRLAHRVYDQHLTPLHGLQKEDWFFVTTSVLLSDRAAQRYFRCVLREMEVPADDATIANIVSLAQSWSSRGAFARLGAAVPMMVLCFVGEDDQSRTISRAIAESTRWKGVPASRSAIEGFEKITIGVSEAGTCGCTICLDDFDLGCQTVRLPCLHLFHADCITEWLRSSYSCPLCRFQMAT